MKHLDLFSGIGGFALAAQKVWDQEHEIVSFCEIEPFSQKVLKKHWPAVPCHSDIKTLGGAQFGTIDLITGGFPCQPFSCSGEQKGISDSRFLWPEMLRVIKECRPTWIIGENVSGAISILKEIKDDLEAVGFDSALFDIPASALGFPHHRRRMWIVAHSNGSRLESVPERYDETKSIHNKTSNSLAACSAAKRLHGRRDCNSTRRGHGVPNRTHRVKGIGNAIVPQAVIPIMEAIKAVNAVEL